MNLWIYCYPMSFCCINIVIIITTIVIVTVNPHHNPYKVVEILHDWLDIDFSVAEECLSLAVWTPVRFSLHV